MPKQTGSIDLSSQKQAHDDASKTATNYIRADGTGIRIANSNPDNATTYQHQTSEKTEFTVNNIIASDISSDGLRIYDRKSGLYSTDSVIAHFGKSSRIGFKSGIHSDVFDLGFDVSSGPDKLFSVEIDDSDEIKYNIIHYWMSTDDSNNTYATIPANSTGSYTATFSRTALDSYSDYLTKRVWKYSDETYWHNFDTNTGTPLTNGYASINSSEVNNDLIISYEEGWTNTSSKDVNIAYASVSDSRNVLLTIGKTSTSVLKMDYHSLKMIGKEGRTYFHVSDLRDETGTATVSERFIGDGYSIEFYLNSIPATSIVSLTVDETEIDLSVEEPEVELVDGNKIHFMSSAPNPGSVIEVVYTTTDLYVTAATFGWRASGYIGPNSFASGQGIVASANSSTAFGFGTKAIGKGSFSEGFNNIANGAYAHVEGGGLYSYVDQYGDQSYKNIASGDSAHAEGMDNIASGRAAHVEGGYAFYNTANYGEYNAGNLASGDSSHAEGIYAKAIGEASHAQNIGTIASGGGQTAIGRYNIQNDSNSFAFIVGNGGDSSNRSNALTLAWDGTINLPAITLSQSGTGLIINGSNLKNSGETNDASANLWGTALEIRDKGNNQRSYIRHFETTNNHQGIQVETRRYINNAWVYNGLRLSVDGTGALAVAVASGTSWRNAIFGVTNGVVPASLGGTGYTSLQATRNGMGLGNTLGALPIANGGSGMTACAQGNISPASGTTVGNLVYRYWGKIVTIYMYNIKFTVAVANNGSHDVGTVPSGYRPSYISFAQVATSKLTGLAYMRIDTAGAITFHNESGANLSAGSTVSCTLTYVAT